MSSYQLARSNHYDLSIYGTSQSQSCSYSSLCPAKSIMLQNKIIKKKDFSGDRCTSDFKEGGHKSSFVNGEIWVVFGAQKIEERKRLLKS